MTNTSETFIGRISFMDVDVFEVDPSDIRLGRMVARIDYSKMDIYVSRDLAPKARKTVLLHELGHLIMWLSDTAPDCAAKEEVYSTALGYAVSDLWSGVFSTSIHTWLCETKDFVKDERSEGK